MRQKEILAFRKVVWKQYAEHGRHDLPWRQPSLKLRHAKTKTFDPYHILVSEIMLQQTQVSRVLEKYKEFLKAFPSIRALAKAHLSGVLKAWSGLGYNRRGKYLHDAAKEIVLQHKGKLPNTIAALRSLPGVGPYTASAVRVFAFNKPDVLIETNIRTAYTYHFCSDVPYVSDREIKAHAEKVAGRQDPREWHWALMDYGAHLKKTGVRNNSRSAHYIRQSIFKGSQRQIRGAIMRSLIKGKKSEKKLRSDLHDLKSDPRHFAQALESLARDHLITQDAGSWRIL